MRDETQNYIVVFMSSLSKYNEQFNACHVYDNTGVPEEEKKCQNSQECKRCRLPAYTEEPNTVHGCKHVIIPVGDQCTATILHISMYRRCSCNFIGSREHCTVQIQTIFVSISVMSVTTSKIQMNDWTIHCLCSQKSSFVVDLQQASKDSCYWISCSIQKSLNARICKNIDKCEHTLDRNKYIANAKTSTNVTTL